MDRSVYTRSAAAPPLPRGLDVKAPAFASWSPVDAMDAARATLTVALDSARASIAHRFDDDDDDVVEPKAAADDILRCLSGPILDLSTLDKPTAKLLGDMPAIGWEALDQLAVARGSGSISRVVLPDAFACVSNLDVLSMGLASLPGLGFLSMPAPDSNNIHLDLLQHSLRPSVEIRCKAHRTLDVRVPLGTQVWATASPGDDKGRVAASMKSWVTYVDDKGVPLPGGQTLCGLIHDHTSHDLLRPRQPGWDDDSDEEERQERQEMAAGIDLNGKARLASNQEIIWCRNLALQWLADRNAHHDRKDKSEKFSYKHYLSGDAISKHVKPQVERDCLAMEKAGARISFEASRFGSALADELEDMRVGDRRSFALGTPNHMMSVELQVKGPQELVVNVYDPNRTATHRRVVVRSLDELRNMPLSRWIDRELLEGYFENCQPCIGQLYDWPPRPRSAARDMDRYIPDAARATPQRLFEVLSNGDADEVTAAVGAILATPMDRAQRVACLAAYAGGCSGVCQAMRLGHTKAVEAYVSAILQAPPDVLSSDEKFQLLNATQKGVHSLSAAIECGEIATVACFTRAILAAREDALQPKLKQDILLARGLPPMFSEGGPPLNWICSKDWGKCDPDLRLRRELAIQAHVRAILQSSLPDEEKEASCAAIYRGQTAAQGALEAGNPGAAAAMVCAVLDAFPDTPSRERWLGILGLQPEKVRALRAHVRADWASRIEASFRRGARPAAAALPAVPLAGAAPMPPPMTRFRELARGGGFVMLAAGDELLQERCRSARLRVERLDEHADGGAAAVLCSAEHAIAGMPAEFIAPFPDDKAAVEGRDYYWVPLHLLEAAAPPIGSELRL